MATSVAGRQLFVGNLPFIVGWQDLKDLFRGAGSVIRADVATSPTGRSRGFGTVLFATVEEAQNAIATLNNFEWHGRKIEVREDRLSGGAVAPAAAAPPTSSSPTPGAQPNGLSSPPVAPPTRGEVDPAARHRPAVL
ncbi:hypothetical protein HK102_011599, partial [Quaeritorhiza haematococci]